VNGDIVLAGGDRVSVRAKVVTELVTRGRDTIEKRSTELHATWTQYDRKRGWVSFSEVVESVEAARGKPVVILRTNGQKVTLGNAERIVCSTATGGYVAEGYWAGGN
jgi:hypothetical protein